MAEACLTTERFVVDARGMAAPEPTLIGWRSFWTRQAASPARMLLSLLSAAMILRAIVFVLRHYTPEAFFDFWFWVSDFQLWLERHYTLHDLLKAHYGQHRIATTRVLLLVDSILFGMSGLSVVLANLAILTCAGLLLWRMGRADGVARTGWALPPLFWVALMLAVAQVENLIFPFQVQFALICLTSAGAAALLTRACGVAGCAGVALAAGAGLCSLGAMFSMASGVLSVPGLLILLALRRARPAIWLTYTPIALAGIAAFFHHYPSSPRAPLFDAGLAVTRILYVGNFLGSALTGFPHIAAGAGLCALALFLAASWALVRRFSLAGRPVASGDAALVALGVGVVLCGPAASMTFRIMMGAQAALVSRYATMSVLFAAVLFGLFSRWGARAAWPLWVREAALPLAAGSVLLVLNAPIYDAIGAGWHRVVLGDVQVLRNNVALEGPAPVIFLGKVNDVRPQIRFLHAQGINMFGPQDGPPADVLTRLRRADIARLPACRGYVDSAVAVDDGAFLLRGWLADPASRHTLTWIGAVDAQGRILGTSRALAARPDVADALHLATPGLGYEAGFRLLPPLRFGADAVPIRIVGLDPGREPALCALATPALIGPVQVTPVEELGALTALVGGSPAARGFLPLQGDRPFPGPAWSVPETDHETSTLRFTLSASSSSGQAVILPFLVASGDGAGGGITFRLGDGTVLATPLAWVWNRPAWRAAVLLPEILQAHGGVLEVDVTTAPGTSLVVGRPMGAQRRPGWSQLF